MIKLNVEIASPEFYELLIALFSKDVQYELLLYDVSMPWYSEIIDFINYIKAGNKKEDIMQYKLSLESKKIILEFIEKIFNKTNKK